MTEAQFEVWSWAMTLGALALALSIGGVVMKALAWVRPPYPSEDDLFVDAAYHRCIVCGAVKVEEQLEPALPIYMPQADCIEWKCKGVCVEPLRAA